MWTVRLPLRVGNFNSSPLPNALLKPKLELSLGFLLVSVSPIPIHRPRPHTERRGHSQQVSVHVKRVWQWSIASQSQGGQPSNHCFPPPIGTSLTVSTPPPSLQHRRLRSWSRQHGSAAYCWWRDRCPEKAVLGAADLDRERLLLLLLLLVVVCLRQYLRLDPVVALQSFPPGIDPEQYPQCHQQ